MRITAALKLTLYTRAIRPAISRLETWVPEFHPNFARVPATSSFGMSTSAANRSHHRSTGSAPDAVRTVSTHAELVRVMRCPNSWNKVKIRADSGLLVMAPPAYQGIRPRTRASLRRTHQTDRLSATLARFSQREGHRNKSRWSRHLETIPRPTNALASQESGGRTL